MTTYTFIFSNRFTYRILRHAVFWIVWTLFWIVTFAVPNYTVPSWNLSEWRAKFGDESLLSRIIEGFFSTWYRNLPLYMLFAYFIIYYLSPKYFSNKKKVWHISLIALSFFAVVFVLLFLNMHWAFKTSIKQGKRPFMPGNTYIFVVACKSFFFNFPAAAGIALAIKLLKRWWLIQKETQQLASEKAKAELQLLKAQIHPHFLFNTLNNIYFFTLSSSRQAPEMIKKLSDLLRYILNECNQPTVPLVKEIKMIQDYMALEKIRYGEQLEMTVSIEGAYQRKTIAPLLLIPFVENSFKHGASKMLNKAFVKLCINVEENDLSFLLSNNKPVLSATSENKKSIGLKNVKKRLQLLYPGTHDLNIVSEPESFTVYLKLDLKKAAGLFDKPEEKNQTAGYAMV